MKRLYKIVNPRAKGYGAVFVWDDSTNSGVYVVGNGNVKKGNTVQVYKWDPTSPSIKELTVLNVGG